MDYTVERNTQAIAFPFPGLWTKDKGRVIRTKYTTTFNDEEVVVHPNRIPDELPSDESVVRAAYGIMGYFAFQQWAAPWILVVPIEGVLIHTDDGIRKEEIKDALLSECGNKTGGTGDEPGPHPNVTDPKRDAGSRQQHLCEHGPKIPGGEARE
jgi:hypothetical protein